MSRGSLLIEDDIPPTLSCGGDEGLIRIPIGTSMEEAERIIIRETISAQKGNKTRAAEILGIGRKTLHRKMDGPGD